MKYKLARKDWELIGISMGWIEPRVIKSSSDKFSKTAQSLSDPAWWASQAKEQLGPAYKDPPNAPNGYDAPTKEVPKELYWGPEIIQDEGPWKGKIGYSKYVLDKSGTDMNSGWAELEDNEVGDLDY